MSVWHCPEHAVEWDGPVAFAARNGTPVPPCWVGGCSTPPRPGKWFSENAGARIKWSNAMTSGYSYTPGREAA